MPFIRGSERVRETSNFGGKPEPPCLFLDPWLLNVFDRSPIPADSAAFEERNERKDDYYSTTTTSTVNWA